MSQPSSSKTSVLNELRQNKTFCDAVVKVENVEFPIHKSLLCKSSEYFRALFERWYNHSKRDFTLPGLSAKTMELILDWVYTGSVILTKKNVQNLLLAADMFNILDLVDFCFNYIENSICAENCIGIWKLADVVISERVRQKAHRFILDHFENILVCDEFQELTAEELRNFIESDELIVKNEKVVYEAVLHWTNYALEGRSTEFPTLLSKVRLAQIDPNILRTNVINHDLVKDNIECMSVVADAVQASYELAINRMSSFRNPLARPRLPGAVLLAIGGWSGGDPTNGIEAYDFQADRWVNVTNHHERPRAYHGSVFLNASVYCVGGFDRMEHFNSMRRLDLSTRTWHEMPPMYYRRCYVSVTVLNGCIYAMGGYNGQTRLSTAEVYNPETNQWSLIAPMQEQRSDANCTTLNGKIYICGGFNGTECLQSAESYCPVTNQWTMIASMTTRRSGIAVIAFANRIYAAGGFDGNVRLRSAEVYNPRTNTWRPVASMLTPRSNFGIEVLDDRIFAVGGFNGFTTTYNVESYDHVTDQWTEVCDMDIFRSALSCCIISGLPNMADYTVSRDALSLLDIEESDEDSNSN